MPDPILIQSKITGCVIIMYIGDKTVKVWDTREQMARVTIMAHEHEILTLDWNKYNEFVFASGGADCKVCADTMFESSFLRRSL